MAFRALSNNDHNALQCYFMALEIDPKRPDLLFNIANIYSGTDFTLAKRFYLDSLRLDPANSSTLLNLGLLI